MSTRGRQPGTASLAPLPLVLHWGRPGAPLPMRPLKAVAIARPGPAAEAPPIGLPTGPRDRPFDFVGHVQRLCVDICRRCPVLRHIDVSRLLIGATQARNGRRRGLQARLTPLRFPGGQLVQTRGAIRYQVQRYLVAGREMFYLMTFCLPRFLDQTFTDKFITVFHELYHIGPAFDGDLRRHPGRCSIHSRSQRAYDEQMADLARDYLALGPDLTLYSFLRFDFQQLVERHGSVVGVMVPRPRLVPLP